MHAAAFDYTKTRANLDAKTVVECGGRDINGTVRGLFQKATYTAVDLYAGPGVDVVGNFTDYTPTSTPDLVVCLEVLEHAKDWKAIISHAAEILGVGGQFVVTAAGPTRAPHSGLDGGEVRPDEWYENISPAALKRELKKHFGQIEVDELGDDVRGVAVKGGARGAR